MSLTEICILIVMVDLCVHSIVSRICKCVENCYIAKYYKGEIPGFEKDKHIHPDKIKEENDIS